MYCRFIISFIVLAISFSCKKTDQVVHFKGNITEATGGGSLEGVDVSFSEKKIQNGTVNANFSLAGQTTTDNNGNFEFDYQREKTIEVRISAQSENFHQQTIYLDDEDLSLVEDNIVNFNLYSKSWVKFIIKNNSPTNTTDELKLVKKNPVEGCEGCCQNDAQTFNGEVDTEFVCATGGNVFFNFNYIVTDNSGVQFVEDSVYCEPNDTAQIFITY